MLQIMASKIWATRQRFPKYHRKNYGKENYYSWAKNHYKQIILGKKWAKNWWRASENVYQKVLTKEQVQKLVRWARDYIIGYLLNQMQQGMIKLPWQSSTTGHQLWTCKNLQSLNRWSKNLINHCSLDFDHSICKKCSLYINGSCYWQVVVADIFIRALSKTNELPHWHCSYHCF